MLGRFDSERISKSVLRLLSTAKTKMKIVIAVQHQDACSVAGQGLYSSENDNKKLYVNIVDNFYVIVHTRIRRVILK